jgi:hypothetical protein
MFLCWVSDPEKFIFVGSKTFYNEVLWIPWCTLYSILWVYPCTHVSMYPSIQVSMWEKCPVNTKGVVSTLKVRLNEIFSLNWFHQTILQDFGFGLKLTRNSDLVVWSNSVNTHSLNSCTHCALTVSFRAHSCILHTQQICTVSPHLLGEYAQFHSGYSMRAYSFNSHIGTCFLW